MVLTYRLYNLDNTVEGGKGNNQYTDIIVREVYWKRNEPDYAILYGSNSLEEGDEVCITKYDKSSNTETVIFVGFVQNRALKGGKYQYMVYGFENKFTGMYKTFDYVNTTVEDLLIDMFANMKGRFHITVFHDADGAYQQLLTLRGVYAIWDMIIAVVNALGWELRISHSLSYYDSGSSTYKVQVDIKPMSEYSPLNVYSSYYAKKCSSSYGCIVKSIKKDMAKIINQYLVSTSPTYVNNYETFSSWTDNGAEVAVRVSYRIDTIRKAQWYDGSNWYDYADTEYHIEGDGYTVDLAKKDGMTEIRIFYKYRYTYWAKVNDYDSINKYGLRSKKIILNWTDNLDTAKQYAGNLLSVSAKPIVKGQLNMVDGTSVDVWDELHLYHDAGCSSYYDVFVSSVIYPSNVVEYQTVDLKYRLWDVDVDSRLKKLEKSDVGEESMITMHYPTISNSFEVHLQPKRAILFPQETDSNSNVWWHINGSAMYDRDMDSYTDWAWIKLDSTAGNYLQEKHYSSGTISLPYGDYIQGSPTRMTMFQYNLSNLNSHMQSLTDQYPFRVSKFQIYVGDTMKKEVRAYYALDSDGNNYLDIKLADSSSDTFVLYDSSNDTWTWDAEINYGSSAVGTICLWIDSDGYLEVGLYSGTSSQQVVVDDSGASQYEFYMSNCYCESYKSTSNDDILEGCDSNGCSGRPQYLIKAVWADVISDTEKNNANLFADKHLTCLGFSDNKGGYYVRKMG